MGAAAKPARPVAAIIGTGFGALWAVLGATAWPKLWTAWAIGAAVIIAVILIGRLWFSVERASGGLFGRNAYRVAVVLEVMAMVAAGYLLPRYGLEAYLECVIGIIVGLHFIGLWRASGNVIFLWIAGAMCAISTAAIALPASPAGFLNMRVLVASYGNALVLWAGSALPFKKGPAHRRAGPS